MGNPADSKVGEAGAPKSGRRRRVLAGAVGATSVLMTVGSRPVLGNGCVSVMLSANTAASHANQACTGLWGSGYTPDDWINTATWPSPYTPS